MDNFQKSCSAQVFPWFKHSLKLSLGFLLEGIHCLKRWRAHWLKLVRCSIWSNRKIWYFFTDKPSNLAVPLISSTRLDHPTSFLLCFLPAEPTEKHLELHGLCAKQTIPTCQDFHRLGAFRRPKPEFFTASTSLSFLSLLSCCFYHRKAWEKGTKPIQHPENRRKLPAKSSWEESICQTIPEKLGNQFALAQWW